jgi:hypothetical protein
MKISWVPMGTSKKNYKKINENFPLKYKYITITFLFAKSVFFVVSVMDKEVDNADKKYRGFCIIIFHIVIIIF